MRKTFTSFVLAMLFTACAWPQADNIFTEAFEDAEYFYARQDYEEAAYYYRQLTSQFPENANYSFKLGECYLNMTGNEVLAIPYLEQAVQYTVERKKYKGKDFEEDRAPLHAWFYLGNAYRINNQLAEALEAYETFIGSPFYYGNYNIAIVENEIAACERAKIIQDHPISMEEEVLGGNINTDASELYPVVSPDEQVLVFIRRLQFYDAILFCDKRNGNWTEPVNLNPLIGSDGEYYPACVSSDKKELYLIRQVDSNADIYVSNRIDSVWTQPVKLNRHINSRADETSAWISGDGLTLYFSSSRRGGAGGKDIYYASRAPDGDWGRAKNLGKTVNSRFDEESPCLTNQGNTLYFSSQGHYSMGGFDIFFANRSEKGWEEPVNAGFPLNDTGDNTGFVAIDGGRTVYLSRLNRLDGSEEDIFQVSVHSNLPLLQESLGQDR